MTDIIEIVKQIWQLPWYKIVAVAMIDDALVFLKLWPIWLIIIGISLLIKLIAVIIEHWPV